MNPHAQKPEPPAGWRDRLKALKNIPPMTRMIWDTSPGLCLASLLSRLTWALTPIAMLWVSKLIVDRVVGAASAKNADPAEIWRLVAIELGLAALGDILMRGTQLADSLLGDRFTNHVSLRLMEHAGSLDLFHFEDPTFYDKLERARRQTTTRLGMLSQIASIGQGFVTLLTVSIAVVAYSPWLLVLLMAALIPVFWGEAKVAVMAYSLLYRWTPERRELDYLRMLGASNNSAKEVKIFGLGPYLTARARELFQVFYRENRKLAIRRAAQGAALNLLPSIGYYGAYAFMLQRTLRGDLSVGDLVVLSGAFMRSRSNLESLFGNLSFVSEQALYLRDLFEFFETRPEIVSKPGALPGPRPIRTGFAFENVGFAYHGSAELVLRDVSFRLAPGEKIALIGENGAGKTTLVKLMARLYDPSHGRITLDGADLRDYQVEDLRREIGVIFQDFMRYDMKAADNIGAGRVERIGDLVRVRESARKSLADEVIEKLKGGYDQMLGRRFDGGVDLSAGQWQKVALGRAYMRDAQLIILDEPTASLDARAEYEVFQRFAELTKDKMAVLISHRFSTVRMADRILVLEQGRIVEQGSHASLVALGGRYSELFELQAAGYR